MAERVVAAFTDRTTRHTFALTARPSLVADVDADGMERVLSNLLDNALKYSPDGGQIDIEVSSAEHKRFRISVRDHGIGIPPEKRDAIFERFYQAHAADYRSGLGLGLYITQQIVALHDGTIDFESPEDGGTRFVVLAPVKAVVKVKAATLAPTA
jgi:signal transduction histidine kinase